MKIVKLITLPMKSSVFLDSEVIFGFLYNEVYVEFLIKKNYGGKNESK